MAGELSDIYSALQEGLAACNSLETWVRGADARDIVKSRRWALERGLRAHESLSRDLRDGRKHLAEHEELSDKAPRAVNLSQADEGHRLCDTCEGQGTGMEMVCYGGNPCERTVECSDCGGEGQIEVAESAPETAMKGN